jgi:hypothetical protein
VQGGDGSERQRRTWSADQKQQIIAESFAPGASVAEVARRDVAVVGRRNGDDLVGPAFLSAGGHLLAHAARDMASYGGDRRTIG